MRSEKGARNRRLSDLEEDGPCFFPAVDADDGLVAVAYETETRNVVLRIVEDVQ